MAPEPVMAAESVDRIVVHFCNLDANLVSKLETDARSF